MRILCIFFCCCIGQVFAQTTTKPNLILIICDDLNDHVVPFGGSSNMQTPNINSLAEKGTVFLNAFSNCVVCAPSRTSMLSGKTAHYTGVYNNLEYIDEDFRANFPDSLYIETLPQYLKDSAGYFTYCINKVFHVPQYYPDFDTLTDDACAKSLSWNKMIVTDNGTGLAAAGSDNDAGVEHFTWTKLDSSFTVLMKDYIATDSAISFLQTYDDDAALFCNKPFFLALGYHKPHSELYIPEQYFSDYYVDDFFSEPFNIPFNNPEGKYPPNGMCLPPQPAEAYADYYALGKLGRYFAAPFIHNDFSEWVDSLPALPVIDATLSEEEIKEILTQSKQANAVMAYEAAIEFIDTQFGRFMKELELHPDVYNNTVLIFTSDHGYALDEKKHYEKDVLWETVIRVPFIICDLRNIKKQTCSRTVSLLDIYPTFCAYAGDEFPIFSNGQKYLDGESLVSLVNNAQKTFERPVLTIMKTYEDRNGSCYEQYSVSNEKYHYIRYQDDGTEDYLGCDETKSFMEEELYEIGSSRDVDPEEWNNIIYNEEYAPVVQYLSGFIPGGEHYLQKMFSTVIHTDTDAPCFYAANDVIHLACDVYDAEGNLLDLSSTTQYSIEWTNSITSKILYGNAIDFSMHEISEADFHALDHIVFYVHVKEIPSNKTLAFQTVKIFINSANQPFVNYCVTLDSLTATIQGYTLQGSVQDASWNFGEGVIQQVDIPGPYTYTDQGTYTIENTILFGNGCSASFPFLLNTTQPEIPQLGIQDFIYPNPASQYVTISFSDKTEVEKIEVIDILGQQIHAYNLHCNTSNSTIDVSALRPQTYLIKIYTPGGILHDKLVISR